VKQGHFGFDLESNLGVHGVFGQLQATGLRLTYRVSRVLNRQNSRVEVNSTNLAHTVKYWLFASSKTMAERYHKSEFGNSTLGPGPPFSRPVCYEGLKTVVVPLPDDLPFAELQKHGKKPFICPPAGMDPKGTAKVPTHSTSSAARSMSAISCFILYICRDMAPFRPLQGRSQVSLLAEGRQEVGEFLQDYIGGKELF
jgi:hypothetical protein